jgi:hypothetical protein
MTIKMRYCCNCGTELGVIASANYDRFDTCGKQECDREARYQAQAEEAEARERAEQDEFSRYR